MLALTKKAGYALIAMSHLARADGEKLASARGIAERFGISTSLLMNVLKLLAGAGYVDSVRGAHGGYRLARRPEQINLAEVITAIEGPIRLAECLSGEARENETCECKVMARCPIADPVHRVQRKLSDFLKSVTLAEVAKPAATFEPQEQEAL